MNHLGGHANITHLDQGVLEMAKTMGLRTMLDIGCGPGGMLKLAGEMGFTCEGIDGMPGKNQIKEVKINIHDFTTGAFQHKQTYDLGYSCEFVEHVREEYLDNFMNSFKSCRFVFMTFAPPGTPGHHHVNCRNEQYWKDKFKENGFEYLQEETLNLRKSSTMKRDFVRKCGLVFRNLDL